MTQHTIEKVRNETRRRTIVVSDIQHVTPKMLRLVFKSQDLHDFVSRSPDDHIKLFIPDDTAPNGIAARDYTPRAYDPGSGSLTIDFALHDGGAATNWARQARPGARLEIGGPRGSTIVHDTFDHYLLIGDETALPSIARRVEELRPGVPVTVLAIVDDAAEEQSFDTRAAVNPIWIHRNGKIGQDASLIQSQLEQWSVPQGDGFVWIAGEARLSKHLREYMLSTRQHRREWVRAAGYWVNGAAGASERFD